MLRVDAARELRALLAKLATVRGDATTTADVAELLRAELAAGEFRRPDACPVARYLERLDPDVAPSVLPFAVWCLPAPGDLPLVHVPLPPVVAAFVREFDAGHHADLEGRP